MASFTFLDYVEVTCPGWVGGWLGGWPESDNMTISVQLNLTGTDTGTELGNRFGFISLKTTHPGQDETESRLSKMETNKTRGEEMRMSQNFLSENTSPYFLVFNEKNQIWTGL